jgi:competence protein ComGC
MAHKVSIAFTLYSMLMLMLVLSAPLLCIC